MKDEGGHHADGDAVNAFRAFVQVGHDARQAVTPVRQAARQVRPEQAVKNGGDGQQGQEDAHGSAGRLDHHGNGDHAHHQIQRCVLAWPLNVDVFKENQQVQRKARGQCGKHPVAPWDVGVAAIKVFEGQGQASQRDQHRHEGVAHGVGYGF